MTDGPGPAPGPELDALRQSEERFRKIFEHSHDAIFLVDPDKDAILDANARACQLLGYTREELLTVPPSLVHSHEIERLQAFTRSVLDVGSGWTAELSCRTKSGEIVPAEISASVVEIGGARRLLGMVRDVRERHRLQEALRMHAARLERLVDEHTDELQRSRERQRVLLEVNNALVRHRTRDELFAAIAEALHPLLPFDRSSIFLRDPGGDTLTLWALVGAVGSAPVGTTWPRKGSNAGWILDNESPMVIPDWRSESRFAERPAVLGAGILSTVSVPLVTRGREIGVLHLGSQEPDRYTAEDAGFLRAVGEQVALAVENMLAYEEIARLKARLEEENVYLKEEARSERGLDGIIGESRPIRRVKEAVATVAGTDATVLINGETGTGKELVADAIHDRSPRRGKTMVKVNCAALPASLIESELFGHEKGAFTGAVAQKPGRFELADRGTIFLDEVGDLPLELQAKLLRVLQQGEFERVGGTQTLKVSVRVVAATNQDLEKAVRAGRFRADLFYRLNVFPIRVPPLRERREDIPVLVRHLVLRKAARLARPVEEVPEREMETLLAYDWPGNVRELENVVERAVILTRGPVLQLEDCLPLAAPAPVSPSGSRVQTLAEVERSYVLEILKATRGRVSGPQGAARLLGIKPTTLEARIRRLGIQKPR
jgi:formate hydrogenlyase transcriptional activator